MEGVFEDTGIEWLTEELAGKTRRVFEPRYGRALTKIEVVSIAKNLVGLLESVLESNQPVGHNIDSVLTKEVNLT